MRSSAVEIQTPDGVADAYLTRPGEGGRAGEGGPYPGVLFLIDAFGLRPRIEEMADRIAAEGYVVLAPNLFYRAGRPPVLPMPDMTDPDSRMEFFRSVRPLMEQIDPEGDGGAYLDYLQSLAPGPFAITGYCMGARIGWRIAVAHRDRVAALGGFHAGGLVTDAPDSPHRLADQLDAELYLGFADQDQSMSAEQIATLERALEEAGTRYRSEIYEGASHGYTMSDTAAWNEAAAERHFRELFGLLERTLGAEAGAR
jgi:carboxymethylenebutenolidase